MLRNGKTNFWKRSHFANDNGVKRTNENVFEAFHKKGRLYSPNPLRPLASCSCNASWNWIMSSCDGR